MDLNSFFRGWSLIWPASMLFFGRIPSGLTHIPPQLIAAARVGCFGGDRREQPTINAPRPSPFAPLRRTRPPLLKPPQLVVCCVLPRRQPNHSAPAAPALCAPAPAPALCAPLPLPACQAQPRARCPPQTPSAGSRRRLGNGRLGPGGKGAHRAGPWRGQGHTGRVPGGRDALAAGQHCGGLGFTAVTRQFTNVIAKCKTKFTNVIDKYKP